MPRQATFVVQRYELVDGEVQPGSTVQYGSAQEAIVEAIRTAPRVLGVTVCELKVDTATGVPVDGPYCLAEFGRVTEQFHAHDMARPVYEDIH